MSPVVFMGSFKLFGQDTALDAAHPCWRARTGAGTTVSWNQASDGATPAPAGRAAADAERPWRISATQTVAMTAGMAMA